MLIRFPSIPGLASPGPLPGPWRAARIETHLRLARGLHVSLLLTMAAAFLACADPQPVLDGPESWMPLSLVAAWDEVRVDSPVAVPQDVARSEIRFDGDGLEGVRWQAISGIEDLRIEDGKLVGTSTSESPVVEFRLDDLIAADDELWSVELSVGAESGSRAGVHPMLSPGPPVPVALARIEDWPLSTPLVAGSEAKTYKVVLDQVFLLEMPLATRSIDHLLVRPTNVAGAKFEIDSVRLVLRREHLASISSGPGWHGLGEVFRESLVARVPETLAYTVDLPANPWLDLAVGKVEGGAQTFRVSITPADADEDAAPVVAAQLEVGEGDTWMPTRIDLADWAGQRVELRLEAPAHSEPAEDVGEGSVVFWGSPTLRSSRTVAEKANGGPAERPQAVVIYLADTLRKDHLKAWGYERETAPTLSRLAAEGVRFDDTLSQATWTKASVSSILTSLYPATTGVVNLNDRIAASETTLAEAFRSAGYATFATSSVPFTGQLTNLHQGVEVMYELGAAGTTEGFQSKSSTTWVDTYLEWLELHSDVPTFAFVHVMDPHSPFRPEAPWDTEWATVEDAARFEQQAEKVRPVIKSPLLKRFLAPTREELRQAQVDEASFVAHEKAWYDGSIRGLDENLGRLVSRLDELGLGEDSLLAFISDHGEEFLDHGKHWHGQTVFGEVTNIPWVMWGQPLTRLGIEPGLEIEETVQALDLMPTLLDLAGIEIPERAQGRSLVPLLQRTAQSRSVPAFVEYRGRENDPEDPTSFAVVEEGWKLIWYPDAAEGDQQYLLFDHDADPLDQDDLAARHPEVVEKLAERLERWRQWAEGQRLDEAEELQAMDAEELERLRSLGYVQ